MCIFILPAEAIISTNNSNYWFYFIAGKKFYSEWKKKSENAGRKENETIMANLNDIFANEEEHLSEDELLKYLHSEMSESEKQAIEQKMVSSSFESDAAEGLQQMKNVNLIQQNVVQLNKKLRNQLRIRKTRNKLSDKTMQWIILAIVLVLFICTTTYGIIHLLHH